MSVSYSNGVTSIPHIERQVHEGGMFLAAYTVPHASPVADDASLDLLIVTGAKPVYIEWRAAGGGDTEVYLFEGVTASNNGTAVAAHNMNRNASDTPETAIYHTPTLSDTGTELMDLFEPGGTGPKAGGDSVRVDTEWVLQPDTAYLLRTTNRSGATAQLSVVVQWYEA